jgi:rhodanese-related sulfurtransferase
MEAITLKKLKTMLLDNQNPIFLLDVRTPQEHYSKRIKGAINIPLDTLPSKISILKDQPCIVVHCAHGFRAKRAAEFLYEREQLSVYYVKGDIELWEQAELPVLYEDGVAGPSEGASR